MHHYWTISPWSWTFTFILLSQHILKVTCGHMWNKTNLISYIYFKSFQQGIINTQWDVTTLQHKESDNYLWGHEHSVTVHPKIHDLCDSGVHCLTQAVLEKHKHLMSTDWLMESLLWALNVLVDIDNLFPGGQFLCQHCIRFITWFAFHLF